MKKNVMMRVASIMLVLVLMSSSVISGTFAKYVTQDKATDSARVAHWGVEVVVTGEEAFKTEYADESGLPDENDGLTVKSSTAKKLVAPGTKGTLATVDVNGSPEVDATIEFAADVTISDWLIDHDGDSTADYYYCPLVITVGTTKLVGNTYADAAAFEAAIENQLNNTYTQYYNAHTDLAAVADVTVEWAWNFSTNTDDVEQTDELDTILGDKAADLGDDADYIEFELKVTVTQVD